MKKMEEDNSLLYVGHCSPTGNIIINIYIKDKWKLIHQVSLFNMDMDSYNTLVATEINPHSVIIKVIDNFIYIFGEVDEFDGEVTTCYVRVLNKLTKEIISSWIIDAHVGAVFIDDSRVYLSMGIPAEFSEDKKNFVGLKIFPRSKFEDSNLQEDSSKFWVLQDFVKPSQSSYTKDIVNYIMEMDEKFILCIAGKQIIKYDKNLAPLRIWAMSDFGLKVEMNEIKNILHFEENIYLQGNDFIFSIYLGSSEPALQPLYGIVVNDSIVTFEISENWVIASTLKGKIYIWNRKNLKLHMIVNISSIIEVLSIKEPYIYGFNIEGDLICIYIPLGIIIFKETIEVQLPYVNIKKPSFGVVRPYLEHTINLNNNPWWLFDKNLIYNILPQLPNEIEININQLRQLPQFQNISEQHTENLFANIYSYLNFIKSFIKSHLDHQIHEIEQYLDRNLNMIDPTEVSNYSNFKERYIQIDEFFNNLIKEYSARLEEWRQNFYR
ncbi:MAG: hypothetical protein ACTSRZ_15390 [Promethearchaeota archaeon]